MLRKILTLSNDKPVTLQLATRKHEGFLIILDFKGVFLCNGIEFKLDDIVDIKSRTIILENWIL